MNVLVADDDGIIRLLLNAALTRLGHSVEEANNGRAALAAWRKKHHSLIISDWMMPDLDGLELCRQVRAQKGADFAYIILLTSRVGKANYLEAMQAGADDFIGKPFEQDQLAARVRVAQRILDLHENLRAANGDLERRVSERTVDLEKALAAKSEFLSRASHELRTPMNHVLGFAQILKRSVLSDTQEASVRHILSSGRNLLSLIDRILAVSKSGSDDLSFLETPASKMQGEGTVIPAESIAEPTFR